MGELLSTLPGDIPGLLRRGSPVRYLDSAWRSSPEPNTDGVCGERVVNHVHPTGVWWVGGGLYRPHHLWLDLTDATGRAHAAWWAVEQWRTWEGVDRDVRDLVEDAMRNVPMTPEQIDTLARLCLRLAGRAS